jgi:ABC-type glutathione transport system ATPase component
MFQRTFALYGDDRVIENVLHALDDINYPQEKAINRAADLIDQVRLSHRMMHIARDLSGGEKQRVLRRHDWCMGLLLKRLKRIAWEWSSPPIFHM